MNSNNGDYSFSSSSSSSSISANISLSLLNIPYIKTSDIKLKKRKAGRKKFKETRHPVYKDVRQRNGKWVCELRQPRTKSRLWLGTFSGPDLAARGYDVAVLGLKGESASFNFPQPVNELPRISSASSIEDVEKFKASNSGPSSSVQVDSLLWEGLEKSSQVSEEGISGMYLDEEELFNKPGLLDSMAEGLILTPLAMKRGFNWDDHHLYDVVDLSLWTMD